MQIGLKLKERDWMAHRDPRVWPEKGDILRLREERERHVLGTELHHYTRHSEVAVRYIDVRKSGHTARRQCTMRSWRKWASSPDVTVEQIGG